MFTNKSPKELMFLMEKVCGSFKFSEEYSKNERRLDRINKDKMEINGRLRAMMKDRKKADQLVKDIEKSGQLIEKEVKLETQIFSSRYLALKIDTKTLKAKKKKFDTEMKKNEIEIERLSGIILKNSVGGPQGK